jgi:hypothetical protein
MHCSILTAIPVPLHFLVNEQVHCLAGAHRAGTTGCACLIYFAGTDSIVLSSQYDVLLDSDHQNL